MRKDFRHSVLLCGGDIRPGPREDCPDRVHDHPLPAGYGDAFDVADRRLRHGWSNVRCGQCGLYGWRPGKPCADGSDGPVYPLGVMSR